MLMNTGAVDQEPRIICTGHSLGGALAMLAALDIAVDIKPKQLQV